MGFFKKFGNSGLSQSLFLSLFALLLFSSFSSAFRVTQVTATPSLIKVTTGTTVNVAASIKGDSSGTATQTVLTGTGQSSGAALRVVNPASGFFSGTQVTTSVTALSFLVTASLADSYNFKVTSTYTGGSVSSPSSTIQFIDPGTLTVSGSVASTSLRIGDTDVVGVTLTNPGASNVTSSFNFSANPSAFTVVNGDSTAGIITLTPGGSYTFSWTLSAKAAISSSPINFSLGSNPQAFTKSLTVSSPLPTVPPSSGGSRPTAVPTAVTSPFGSSSSSSSGPSAPGTSITEPAAASSEVSQPLGVSSQVTGSFASDSTTFTLAYSAPDAGFSGLLSYHLPLDYADYQNGLVTLSPEPSSVKPGSIIAVWNVDLAPKETFTATVRLAKKSDSSILGQFKPPLVMPRALPTQAAGSPAPASAEPQNPPSTPAAGTPWALALVGLVVLGFLAWFFLVRKN